MQADRHLCCSLAGQVNVSGFNKQKFRSKGSLFISEGWYVSYLVGNPGDMFSCDGALMSKPQINSVILL